MAKLDPTRVVSAADYERARPEYRPLISSERRRRRLRLADACSLQFETQEFALWHVQELLRVEGWTLPRARRTVGDVEPWCPAPGELVATVMVDTDNPAVAMFIARALARPGAILLRAGQHVLRSEVLEAGFPGDPVWYLRWAVTPQWRTSLRFGCTCLTSWDNASYPAPAATVAAVREDLGAARGPVQPLLHRLIEAKNRSVKPQRPRHEARS